MNQKIFEKYNEQLFEYDFFKMFDKYRGVKIKLNTRDSMNASHVHDRIEDRSNLDFDTFSKKFKHFIDQVIDKFKGETGKYLAVFKNSKLKVPFEFIKNPEPEADIFTVLSANMFTNKFDYTIVLDEEVEIIADQK